MITGDLVCGCCGDRARIWIRGQWARCGKHEERNPCVVEGCTRTRAAPEREGGGTALADDQWICSAHWRRYVPPRSRERNLYHRHFRRAKRLGWNDDRAASFWAFWNRLVERVRERARDGHLDEAEIHRAMGWDLP